MADDRKKPEGEAAEAAAEPQAKAGGGMAALLPLIIAVVLMPVLAFAMTKFMIVPQLQKSLGIKEAAAGGHGAAKSAPEGKKFSVPFNKLLVNVAGTMGSRYLLVSVTVVGVGGEEYKKKLEEDDAQLRDMAMGALASKTLADLEKPGARNLIRTELINGFNNILGGDVIKEIYITEFGIQ